MKMVMVIIGEQLAGGLMEKVTGAGFRITVSTSTGGFLRRGHRTLMSVVEDEELPVVLGIIKEYSEKKKLQNIEKAEDKTKVSLEGIATVFVLPVEREIQF